MGTIKVSNQRFCSLYHVTLFCDALLHYICTIRTHSHTYNTNDPMELCKIVNRPIGINHNCLKVKHSEKWFLAGFYKMHNLHNYAQLCIFV